MNKKTVIFLKTIRTASTNNLCILRRLAVENFVEKTYCIAEVDNLNSLLENLYISNQHSPASRAKAILDDLDNSIWPNSIKVSSVRNPWDQAVSAFWRTFVGTEFSKLPNNKANRKLAFTASLDNQSEESIKLAKTIFLNSLDLIKNALDKYPALEIPPHEMEKDKDSEINRIHRDVLFSLQRTLNVLMIDGVFVGDFYIKYEDMENDWCKLLSMLNIDKEYLLNKHRNQPKGPIKNDLGNPVPRGWGCFNNFLLENNATRNIKSEQYHYKNWYQNKSEEIINNLMSPLIEKFNYKF